MIEDRPREDTTVFFYCFWLEKVGSIRISEILWYDASEIVRLTDRLIDDTAKWLFDITDEGLPFIESLMIESLIELEPIEAEERLDEVKEKCIADVEEEVIPIDLCARISSHPVHLSIVFMEKVFRSIPFDTEEFVASLTELRIACESMEFIRCVLLYFIFGSEFSQYCLLIQDLIRDTDTSERIRFLPFESHVLFFSEESIPIRIITDHVDESEIFLHEDEEDGETF